jgi:hypothetical protein
MVVVSSSQADSGVGSLATTDVDGSSRAVLHRTDDGIALIDTRVGTGTTTGTPSEGETT